jgi:hypothetical protein
MRYYIQIGKICESAIIATGGRAVGKRYSHFFGFLFFALLEIKHRELTSQNKQQKSLFQSNYPTDQLADPMNRF